MRREGWSEDLNSRDELTRLLLQVIARLSPCTFSSLIGYVSGDDSDRGSATPGSPTRNAVLDTLLKLEILDFIRSSQEQISITDKGRQYLNRPPHLTSQPQKIHRAPTSLAKYSEWLEGFYQQGLGAGHLLVRRVLPLTGELAHRGSRVATKICRGSAASIVGSKARTLAAIYNTILGSCHRETRALLAMSVKAIRTPANYARDGRAATLLITLSALTLFVIGGISFLSLNAESSGGGGIHFRSGTITDSAAHTVLLIRTEGLGKAALTASEQKPEQTAAGTPNSVEQPALDPVVAAIRAWFSFPALRKTRSTEDLAALEGFYSGHDGPPLWTTSTGFTVQGQAIISEIQKGDEWGLSSAAFDLPAVPSAPQTAETQAADEIKLGLAILQYARFARGGRLSPSRISKLLDQRPQLLDPKTVLSEISASGTPDAYLRSLHPKQEQFERLRQALLTARAKYEAQGKSPAKQRDVQVLIVNMERWRWMPTELGSYYVWDNIPEFVARVVKDRKTIYVDKTIVGQPKYPTPIFSAEMRSIVFNPEWTVPETIIREDLKPALQQGGFFGGPSTTILEQHGLKVSYAGHPVDADSVDWANANVWQYTFTQAPGPDNVLGSLKFNFPNKHAIYMHDTVQPELFAETQRTLSHGCIRVHEPDHLAALLLAEDKGWSAMQIKTMHTGNNSIVMLNRPVPVHLTYFTAVVDDQGEVETFSDVYELDYKMGSALFGKAVKIDAPTFEPPDQNAQSTSSSWRSAERTGGLADAISGLFGN